MTINKDPLAYLFHVLRYRKAIGPNATEAEQFDKLIKGLPPHLKACFVQDQSITVEQFTERLKDVAGEYAYKQKALFQDNLYTHQNHYGTLTRPLFPSKSYYQLASPLHLQTISLVVKY